MRNAKTRLLSLVLAVIMVVSMLPATVLADETDILQLSEGDLTPAVTYTDSEGAVTSYYVDASLDAANTTDRIYLTMMDAMEAVFAQWAVTGKGTVTLYQDYILPPDYNMAVSADETDTETDVIEAMAAARTNDQHIVVGAGQSLEFNLNGYELKYDGVEDSSGAKACRLFGISGTDAANPAYLKVYGGTVTTNSTSAGAILRIPVVNSEAVHLGTVEFVDCTINNNGTGSNTAFSVVATEDCHIVLDKVTFNGNEKNMFLTTSKADASNVYMQGGTTIYNPAAFAVRVRAGKLYLRDAVIYTSGTYTEAADGYGIIEQQYASADKVILDAATLEKSATPEYAYTYGGTTYNLYKHTVTPNTAAAQAITVNVTGEGTVTGVPATAVVGKYITLTVTPAEGYQLNALTLNGVAQEVTGGTFAFYMPAEAATIEVTFKKLADAVPVVTYQLDAGSPAITFGYRDMGNDTYSVTEGNDVTTDTTYSSYLDGSLDNAKEIAFVLAMKQAISNSYVGTVTLYEDVTLAKSTNMSSKGPYAFGADNNTMFGQLAKNAELVINLNGKTLAASAAKRFMDIVAASDDASVTIADGKLTWPKEMIYANTGSTTLTLNNVELEVAGSKGIVQFRAGTVEGIFNFNGGSMTSAVMFSSGTAGYGKGATINVEGGFTFNGTGATAMTIGDATTTVNISEATFNLGEGAPESLAAIALDKDGNTLTVNLLDGVTDTVSENGQKHVFANVSVPQAITVNVTGEGTVTGAPETAKKDEEITLTIAPAVGYQLDTLTLNGEAQDVTDGTYTFVMPGEAVTIAVTFKALPEVQKVATFVGADGEEHVYGYRAMDDGTYTVAADLLVDTTYTTDGTLAKAKEYAFVLAMKAAKDAGYVGTVTLYEDVELVHTSTNPYSGMSGTSHVFGSPAANSDFTLNLNDKTLSAQLAGAARFLNINASNVKITIDGGTNGTGKFIWPSAALRVNKHADVITVNNAHLEVTNLVDFRAGTSEAIFNLNGGSMTATAMFSQYAAGAGATVNVENGFALTTTATTAMALAAGSTVNISEATFNLGEGAPVDLTAIATAATVNLLDGATDTVSENGQKHEIANVSVPQAITVNVTGEGTVTGAPETAKKDEEITLTIAAAVGYELEALTFNGEAQDVTDGTYTFVMPGEAVTIDVTFKALPEVQKVATFVGADGVENVYGYRAMDDGTYTVAADLLVDTTYTTDGTLAKAKEYAFVLAMEQVVANSYKGTVTLYQDVALACANGTPYSMSASNNIFGSVATGADFTLNLNDKTLSATLAGTSHRFMNINASNVKITIDGGTNGTGKFLWPGVGFRVNKHNDAITVNNAHLEVENFIEFRAGTSEAIFNLNGGSMTATAMFLQSSAGAGATVNVMNGFTLTTTATTAMALTASYTDKDGITYTTAVNIGEATFNLGADASEELTAITAAAITYEGMTHTATTTETGVQHVFAEAAAAPTTYTVTVNTAENGIVEADKAEAAEGETVTLTVTPATNYELSTLKVIDAEGNEVTVTDNAFVMPAKAVTITATFRGTVTLARVGNTLLLKDMIQMRYVFSATTLAYTRDYIYENAGLLVWDAPQTEYVKGTELYEIEGSVDYGSGRYYIDGNGISAKNMGETLYAVYYVQHADGTCTYGPVQEYSPKIYAMNQLGKATTSDLVKNTLIGMLNYGAATQVQQGYKVDELANNELTPEQQTWVYDASKAIAKQDDVSKATWTADSRMTHYGWTLLTQGATTYRRVMKIDKEVVEGAAETGLLYWTEADYAAATVLDPANPSGKYIGLTKYNTAGSQWAADMPGVAAKNLGDTYYICIYLKDADGTMHYSDLATYSAHTYATNQIGKATAAESLKNFSKTLIIYSDAAKAYLGS